MQKICLNLGCGKNPKESNEYEKWINIDTIKTEYIDKLWDLNKGIPSKENSVDLILMDNILEHLNDPMFQIKEIHRVLKDGGKAIIIVPHYSYPGSHILEHKTYFCASSFDSFKDRGEYNFFYGINFKVKKKVSLLYYRHKFNNHPVIATISLLWFPLRKILESLININPYLYEFFFASFFPIYLIRFELIKNG